MEAEERLVEHERRIDRTSQRKPQREDVWTISVNQCDVQSVVIPRAVMFMEIYSGNIATDGDLCWHNEPPQGSLNGHSCLTDT